jgi:hypothetical protein
MELITIHLSHEELKKVTGVSSFLEVLADLKDAGIVKDYKPVIELTFDKAKALHIQTVLEFYEVKKGSITSNQYKKDDNE